MELIRRTAAEWRVLAINTGRSVDLLESGLTDFEVPIRPDFILTSERDVFRPAQNGETWEPFGDWNERCARDHAELFSSAQSVLAEVVDFVTQKTKARVIYHAEGLGGSDRASEEEEMDRITEFIEQAREPASEISLSAQHGLSAVLPRRLSQRRGAGRAGAFDRHPARKYFRRRRSSQRHLDAGRRSRGDAGVSSERDPRSERCGRAARRLRRAKREHGAGVHEALVHFLS